MERGWKFGGLGLVCVLSLTGCLRTQDTRFLTCLPRPAAIEARAYDFHDPFADESIGPETFTRPRAFQEPRSDTRKSSDLRFLQAAREFAPRPHAFWDPLSPTGTAGAQVQPLWRMPTSPSPIASTTQRWDGAPRYNVVR
jgi:hypothetical protein